MNYYESYGLCIESEMLLPELIQTSRRDVDVTMRRGHVTISDYDFDGTVWMRCKSASETCFYWTATGAFLVLNGSEVIFEPIDGVEDALIRLPLTAIALSMILHQRRQLVLHASAVVINDGVIAFMGNKGQGKTTVTAALCGRGYPLVSDDVLAVNTNEQDLPTIPPGFPQFRIWPDSAAAAFGDKSDDLPFLHSQCDKRIRRVEQMFASHALPLRAIYTFADGIDINIRALTGQDSLIQIISNSFGMRYSSELLRGSELSFNLRQCASVANQVPLYRLERSRSLALLPQIVKRIEERHLTSDVTASDIMAADTSFEAISLVHT